MRLFVVLIVLFLFLPGCTINDYQVDNHKLTDLYKHLSSDVSNLFKSYKTVMAVGEKAFTTGLSTKDIKLLKSLFIKINKIKIRLDKLSKRVSKLWKPVNSKFGYTVYKWQVKVTNEIISIYDKILKIGVKAYKNKRRLTAKEFKKIIAYKNKVKALTDTLEISYNKLKGAFTSIYVNQRKDLNKSVRIVKEVVSLLIQILK